MVNELNESNQRLREAVAARRAAVAAGKPAEKWYEGMDFVPSSAAAEGDGETELTESSVDVPDIAGGCCDGGCISRDSVVYPLLQAEEPPAYLPGTMAFLGVLEELRSLHLSKTHDYGDESAGDALANIRNGADMVGIAHWKGALVRAADKMQRLRTYCRVGRLVHEGVEDTLLDLAAYASLALVLFREEVSREESL